MNFYINQVLTEKNKKLLVHRKWKGRIQKKSGKHQAGADEGAESVEVIAETLTEIFEI